MSNIIYSNARAKFLSNSLLGKDRINRMIDSSVEDAIKILSEVNFGDNALIESNFDFEKLIDIEKDK
ncbi:MAG: hypothetical protein MJ066_04555 [Clostridia bacterium]|nr:hypothetical protein [Clostridia bacterium]